VKLRHLAVFVAGSTAAPGFAGPPYLTNDPAPTDLGGWEIYAYASGEGRHSNVDADAGVEFNYGAAPDIQVSAALPLSFSHAEHERWDSGTGHVELGIKYRFLKDRSSGISAAFFPKAILPTSSLSHHERTRFQLPIWVGKDFAGGWSTFGGVGYNLNPGNGNRDFWQAGLAVTNAVTKKFSMGAEITRQASDSVGGTAQTRAGIGSILRFSDHYGLLVSAGPTWADHRTGYHFYGSLGIFY